MRVYLLRHGEAKPAAEDPQRGLTAQGRAEVEAVSRALARLRPNVEQIWHSGKTRAQQSAEILASRLDCLERVSEHSGLAPNDPAASLAEELKGRETELVVVGHLPFLGHLVSLLLLGRERELLDLPSGSLVCLERTAGSWLICWVLIPELLG